MGSFREMLVGVGVSRVRDMVAKAMKKAPAVIFIGKRDSIGRARGTGRGGGRDAREQTLNLILAEMDGFDPDGSVLVLAAYLFTNPRDCHTLLHEAAAAQ